MFSVFGWKLAHNVFSSYSSDIYSKFPFVIFCVPSSVFVYFLCTFFDAKKIDPDKKYVKKWAKKFYFTELNSLKSTQKVHVLGLIVIFRWEWRRIPSYAKRQHKMVEFEDETNMVERGRKKRSANGASAIFNIMASKPHISMRRCVY